MSSRPSLPRRSRPRSGALRLAVVAALLVPAGAAQDTLWVSLNNGTSNYGNSSNPSMSGDGRWTAYQSVGNDDPADGCWDILLHDRQTGLTTSLTGCNTQASPPGQHSAQNPAVSASGSHVVYQRAAVGAGPTTSQILVEPVPGSPTPEVASAGSAGWGNSASTHPDVSAHGAHVVFQSFATNLTADVVSGFQTQVFVRDRGAGTTALVSESFAGGAGGSGTSLHPVVSADGRHVAFSSEASDLLAPGVDTNGRGDVFVRDRDPDGNGVLDEGNATTVRVSLADGGVQANNHCTHPSISADGRLVAFQSAASNLVPGDTNAGFDVFVHDRDPDGNGVLDEGNGTTRRVSVTSLGGQAAGSSRNPALSGDGTCVAFESEAPDLTPSAGTPWVGVFVHDLASGQTRMVSIDSAGFPADFHSGLNNSRIAIDDTGAHVAFTSGASNLASGDTNGFLDVYLHEPCPDPSQDLGGGSAGPSGLAPDFTVCGEAAPDLLATLRLRQAPPGEPTALLLSIAAGPAPGFGGLVVPADPVLRRVGSTDADGALDVLVPAGWGGWSRVAQWLVRDGSGWALSNARAVTLGPDLGVHP